MGAGGVNKAKKSIYEKEDIVGVLEVSIGVSVVEVEVSAVVSESVTV